MAAVFIPLGRKPLTLTTTLTLPPGASILPIGVTLPSLDRNDGVEADDLKRISAATPGINRGSRAMPINVSLIARIESRKRCCKFKNIQSNLVKVNIDASWPVNLSAGIILRRLVGFRSLQATSSDPKLLQNMCGLHFELLESHDV
jgi:hypothetical protein